MTVAQSIRAIRKQMGISQTGFAELSGISQPYLSQIESGVRANLSEAAIDAIAAINHPLYPSPDPRLIAELRNATKPAQVRMVVSESPASYDVVVPMLTQTIHAGDPQPIVSDDAESFNVTKHYRDTIAVSDLTAFEHRRMDSWSGVRVPEGAQS